MMQTGLVHYGNADLTVRNISVWPRTANVSPMSQNIAWIGAAAGILFLIALWFRPQGSQAMKIRRTAGLILVIYCGALAGWIAFIWTSFCGMHPPGSVTLLPVVLWIPTLLLGGWALNAFTHGHAEGDWPALLFGELACAFAILAGLGAQARNNLTWSSFSAMVLALWAAETCVALFFFARSSRMATPARIGAIAAYVFFGLMFWYEQYPVTGDQGSYMIAAAALADHHTFNVLPVISSGEFRAIAPYTSADLFLDDTFTVNGTPGFPARDLGVSILAIPGYLTRGLAGARVEMEAVAVILAVLLYKLVEGVGASRSATVFVWAATGFSLPVLHYSSQIYPELCGATLTTLAFLLLQKKLTAMSAFLLGLSIAALPWFNARYWLLAGPILVVAAARLGRGVSSRRGIALVGPLIISTGVMIGVNIAVYHLALPNAGYVMMLRSSHHKLPVAASYVGWIGLWLDRYWGLFSTAPIFFFVPAGLFALWKRSRSTAVQLLVIGTPYFLAIASTYFWRGGPTATPRYLVPLIPLLAVPVVAAVDAYNTRVIRMIAGFLAVVGGVISAASIVSLDFNYDGVRLGAYVRELYGLPVSAALPDFMDWPVDRISISLSVVWILLIMVVPLTMKHRSLRAPRS